MVPQTYRLNLANNLTILKLPFWYFPWGWGVGWVKVEIKAISAQSTEVGVELSWAELGNKKN